MENNNTQSTLSDIRQTLILNAPIQKVWDAVATSEGIAAWFMPNNFQAELGYEFHLEAGPFGNSPCKVTVLEPPTRLTFEWGKDWSLSFELSDLQGKTEFTLVHSGWDANKVTEFGQSHAEVRDRMSGGWVGLVQKLSTYVEA
ncbi:SRPBCC domain-containing protein [Paenibacillus sp. FSL K6-3182]|uniref:SRPBCC family protein n=1 Tax=Paenibacillus sp. FSL K6-3182 TaxID=2921495 RepID=UPI0030D505DA